MEHAAKLYSLLGFVFELLIFWSPTFLTFNNSPLILATCLSLDSSPTTSDDIINVASKKVEALPVDTVFKFPSPLPSWPPGEGFGNGIIDLGGGLQVCQITSFNKVWATHEGGPDNLGATFFEPSNLPEGFLMLGGYSQPNNRLLHGWVLVGRVSSGSSNDKNSSLKKPVDYSLVWSSENLKIKQDGVGYFWLPVAPDGYKAVGHVVTNSPSKPSIDKVYCVRSDLTDQSETETWVWGPRQETDVNGFNVFNLRPISRGTIAMAVSVGTFIAQGPNDTNATISLASLKNVKLSMSYMPNVNQIKALFATYSPLIYLHPDEEYHPSSVNWYFSNGALLYKKGEESKPIPIELNGSNLPQGGSNDGEYWLDLPVDSNAKERVKKGDLNSSQVYLHIKPTFGATFTDIAIWIFYPFNGPAKARVEFIDIPLGKIGEHVGDWEHLTLRISNFNGELWSVYFSEHNSGIWLIASELEFRNGNKPVSYSSLHGHAMYATPGLALLGGKRIGIKTDKAVSEMVLDTGASFSILSAEYLSQEIVEPPWLNYFNEWGPKITYNFPEEIDNVAKKLPGLLKSAFRKCMNSLPREIISEEGPTGPKIKGSWTGDEA